MNLLIIEDDESVLTYLAIALQGFGYQIATARNLKDGLGLIQDRKFDAVLLDLSLPNGIGVAVVKAIRAVVAGPIVALTGMGAERRREMIEAGANEYLLKGNVKAPEIDRAIRAAKTTYETFHRTGIESDVDILRQTRQESIEDSKRVDPIAAGDRLKPKSP